jgi:hypothetical protein
MSVAKTQTFFSTRSINKNGIQPLAAAILAITPSALEKKLSYPLIAMYWCLGVALAAGVETATSTPTIFMCHMLFAHLHDDDEPKLMKHHRLTMAANLNAIVLPAIPL